MSQSFSDGPVNQAGRLSNSLVHQLIRAGVLQDHHWRDALAECPRHQFVNSFYEPGVTGASWRRVGADSPGFLAAVTSGRALVTAISPLDLWGFQAPVSISPPVDLLVWSLQMLDVFDGANVLELGTGTGHTTALLSHRVGTERVTSIEIDPDQHRAAARTLAGLGLHPRLLAGDSAGLGAPSGQLGGAPHAAVDRVYVGHEMPIVPAAWAELLRPDGVLLVRFSGSLGAGGHLLLNRPQATRSVVSGRFLRQGGPLSPYRVQSRTIAPSPGTAGYSISDVRASRQPSAPHGWVTRSGNTTHSPSALTACGTLALLAQLLLPPGTRAGQRATSTASTDPAVVTYLRAADGSWAEISHSTDRRGRHDTRWAGPTRLLPAVMAAYLLLWLWRDRASPIAHQAPPGDPAPPRNLVTTAAIRTPHPRRQRTRSQSSTPATLPSPSTASGTASVTVPAAVLALLLSAATTDAKTGLLTHTAWQSTATHTISASTTMRRRTVPRSRRWALLMLDIDHFGYLNTRHGHPAADDLLSAVAATLRDSCGPEAVIGRFGGDEFTILLSVTDITELGERAEQLRLAIEALTATVRSPHGAMTISGITASIGAALHPDTVGQASTSSLPEPSSALTVLLWTADLALYDAKHAGRNTTRVRTVDDDHT